MPIAVGVKWVPDKKGMTAGLCVAGFCFGATLWVKLAGSGFGGLLNTTNVFGLPGAQSVFVIYDIVFLLTVMLGSLVMVDPPEGYVPPGWSPPEAVGDNALGSIEMSSQEMIRPPILYVAADLYRVRSGGIDGD